MCVMRRLFNSNDFATSVTLVGDICSTECHSKLKYVAKNISKMALWGSWTEKGMILDVDRVTQERTLAGRLFQTVGAAVRLSFSERVCLSTLQTI